MVTCEEMIYNQIVYGNIENFQLPTAKANAITVLFPWQDEFENVVWNVCDHTVYLWRRVRCKLLSFLVQNESDNIAICRGDKVYCCRSIVEGIWKVVPHYIEISEICWDIKFLFWTGSYNNSNQQSISKRCLCCLFILTWGLSGCCTGKIYNKCEMAQDAYF